MVSLRLTLIVYGETARTLRSQPESVDPSALVDAARLFRSFGENYHERILKEQYKKRLDELAEKFEEIEHQQFGKDGFDDAVTRISRIEQILGLDNLEHY